MSAWNPDGDFNSEHELVRIANGADTLLANHEEFLKGDHNAIPDSELARYVEETDLTADLSGLQDDLKDVESRYAEYTTDMDAEAAVAVRERVPLVRAEAADSGIWHAFSILYFPWFVSHRWEFTGIGAMKKKFWTHGTALDSAANTFERLWWIAELTRQENSEGEYDYTLTKRAFDKRRFVFRVFDIQMGRYKPAVEALIEVLYDEPSEDDEEGAGGIVEDEILDGTIQKFLKSGSTFPYECQTRSDLIETLRGIRAEIEADSS